MAQAMATPTGSGFFIGRFQVYELNAVHERLIEQLWNKHEHVYVVICSNPAPSLTNPLDWELRKALFVERYDDAIEVIEMPDLPDDRVWSQELDRRILELRPARPIVLYGSEDRFASLYSGQFPAEPMEAVLEDVLAAMNPTGITSLRDFCAGAIYGAMRRYPTVYPTVDIALFSPDYRYVLLARKANETGLRFPGGFVDPEDESYEQAALRELEEECGELEIDNFIYLGSHRIDDWRYRNTPDSVMSHLYACTLTSGEPQASDDLMEVLWYEMRRLDASQLIAEHRPLFDLLLPYWEEQTGAPGGSAR